MTTFVNGPAEGVKLHLCRAPAFLRVVSESPFKWDALDLIEDSPQASETIHVYKIISQPGHVHISCRGKRGSGWFVISEYAEHLNPPPDAVLRDNAQWQKWCTEQPRPRIGKALMP